MAQLTRVAWLVPVLWLGGCEGDSQEPPAPEDAAETSGGDDGTIDPVSHDCIDDLSAGLHRFTCPNESQPVYVVNVPEQCLTGSCGLIVGLHGGTSTADLFDSRTNLRALGDQHGYIVLEPSAAGITRGELDTGTWDPVGRDDDRVLDFVRQVMSAWPVDPQRVHVTGFSASGYMTWRFACQHADVFASVAPAAAAHGAQYNLEPHSGEPFVGCSFTGTDRPSQELDILYMHGTRDECFRFESESDEPDSAEDQRDAIIEAWNLTEESLVSSGDQHQHIRHRNEGGTVLEVLWHDYEKDVSQRACWSVWQPPDFRGHCIPGDDNPDGCIGPTAFDWGEELMRFFDER